MNPFCKEKVSSLSCQKGNCFHDMCPNVCVMFCQKMFQPEHFDFNVDMILNYSSINVSFFLQTCYICEESGRESKTSNGACMACNKPGCKLNFHVTW